MLQLHIVYELDLVVAILILAIPVVALVWNVPHEDQKKNNLQLLVI